MADDLYYPRYYRLIARLKKAGLPYPAKCWWCLPNQWAMHRTTQLKSMRSALKQIKGA